MQQVTSHYPKFQHTAARRRLVPLSVFAVLSLPVSTHSRPKAAGSPQNLMYDGYVVSTHSRPKAAGGLDGFQNRKFDVSTHSRPKAAGRQSLRRLPRFARFNTQPPEGGWVRRDVIGTT